MIKLLLQTTSWPAWPIRFRDIQEQFIRQGSFSRAATAVLVLACVLALVAVIDLWLRGRRLDIDSPRRLAIGAINALGLERTERAILRQVVLRSGIEHPVTVLLSPAAFRRALSGSGVSDGAGLEARLFNGQSSENTPAGAEGSE